MSESLSKGGRLQITIIALVFFGPLIFASWMYATGRLQPAGSTNHGDILAPPVNLGEADTLAAPLLDKTHGPWRLVYVNTAICETSCREALHRQRQIRLMLGNEMERVARLFLHGDTPPDKVFLSDQHAGLITIKDKGLAELLELARPIGVPVGGIYLVDPLDNLIMYFSPEIDPGDMADDLKHLLKLSQIG